MNNSRNNPGGAPGGGGASAPTSRNGSTTFSSDTTSENTNYESTTGTQNALLVSGGSSTIKNPTITKSGDDSGDSSDFYGTNAAVLVYNGATLNIEGGTVTTNGGHANAVFSYGEGSTINISKTKITTTSNNSGGIMVTGGGAINAQELTVETAGNSSAAIRSDRGGGTIVAEGGTYKTTGVGSPAIYSTADITVRDAELVSTASEGVVIEGLNSVTLENTTVTDTNNQLNGQSETYKNIFIYQSMSGDASEGTGTFTASDSEFITNQGDHFFITNTTAVINLTKNKFTQNDTIGAFLRAAAGAWGSSGTNGGKVTLNVESQEIFGDIDIDSVSSLAFNLSYSYMKGAIVGDGEKAVTISEDSIWVLTEDSYITTLDNAASDNSNIYANGEHKLYVNGSEVSINQAEAPESFLSDEEVVETVEIVEEAASDSEGFPVWGFVAIGVGAVVIIGAVVAFLVIRGKRMRKNSEQQ